MHSATRGIELVIEPGDIEPADIEPVDIELTEIELVEVELVGGLGGGAAACAPPQLEQWL